MRAHAYRATLIGCACLLPLGGCVAQDPPAQAVVSATPTSARGAESSVRLPPLPEQDPTATVTAAPSPRATPAPAPAPARENSATCGTVTSASGLTLRVKLGEGATDCGLAERVVRAFHRAIAGQQPAESDEPVGAIVDGWKCVSGPPSAQGGTSCSKGAVNVLGAVVSEE